MKYFVLGLGFIVEIDGPFLVIISNSKLYFHGHSWKNKCQDCYGANKLLRSHWSLLKSSSHQVSSNDQLQWLLEPVIFILGSKLKVYLQRNVLTCRISLKALKKKKKKEQAESPAMGVAGENFGWYAIKPCLMLYDNYKNMHVLAVSFGLHIYTQISNDNFSEQSLVCFRYKLNNDYV